MSKGTYYDNQCSGSGTTPNVRDLNSHKGFCSECDRWMELTKKGSLPAHTGRKT